MHSILPLGTRIVTRAPVAGTQHAYPEGTPAVVIEQPTDASHAYRVRLPDGFESSLTRDQFVLLSTVQKGEGIADSLADHDLNEHIIYRCIVGSRAYGLDHDESDTDTRGIYLPPATRHWSLFGVPEQLENKADDEVYWELQKFLILALKANPNILEVLFSPLPLDVHPIAQELLDMRTRFVSKLVFQTYNGYVMSQFKKLSHRVAQGLEPNWKHAMHLLRLLQSGIAALRSGDVPVRVADSQRDRLLEVRAGSIELDTVNAWRLELHREFESSYRTTELPDRPDYEAANAFLIRARQSAVNPT